MASRRCPCGQPGGRRTAKQLYRGAGGVTAVGCVAPSQTKVAEQLIRVYTPTETSQSHGSGSSPSCARKRELSFKGPSHPIPCDVVIRSHFCPPSWATLLHSSPTAAEPEATPRLNRRVAQVRTRCGCSGRDNPPKRRSSGEVKRWRLGGPETEQLGELPWLEPGTAAPETSRSLRRSRALAQAVSSMCRAHRRRSSPKLPSRLLMCLGCRESDG